MPANLPPQYFDAEKVYHAAKTTPEKIAALEEMLAVMPKHKGTDHLRAELRARIAKLTQSLDKKAATRRVSMLIEKEGAAQVAIIGLPNGGKSQLVSRLTNASPTVADYPFTTQTATPAMMEFENIKIQLIDTPPLAPQSIEFWLPHILRRADALVIIVDLGEESLAQMTAITEQLNQMRISLGGETEAEGIISQARALIAGNKLDLANARLNYTAMRDKYGEQLPVIAISARDGTGLDELKQAIFRVLDIIRVYTKMPGQKPDFNEPIILARGSTLADAAEEVHKDFRAKLKYGRVWGSGKHNGMMSKRDHVLQDGDIIELHL